jgi:hypothetical protein
MERFQLSERWCGWKSMDALFAAARAAIEAGPLDPVVCEVVFEADYDPFTVDSLEDAEAHLLEDPDPMSIDISISHIHDDDARITFEYNGHWLQLNGYGDDWTRARQAYYAAQVELSLVYGITTFKLPELPYDTVGETRKRLEIESLEAALGEVDADADDRPHGR